MCVSVTASLFAATLAAHSLTVATSPPDTTAPRSLSRLATRLDGSSLGVQAPVGSNSPISPRPGTAAKPPYPGATTVDRILENIRAGLVGWGSDRRIPLDLHRDRSKIVVSRFFEVEGDTRDDNYYWVDLDRQDGAPLLTAMVFRESGMLFGLSHVFPDGKRHYRLPVLEEVQKRLAETYGSAHAKYYFTLGTSFGVVMYEMPMIAAQTPRGRVIVTWDCNVFEELGFEKDPPGLTPQSKADLRTRQFKEGPLIERDGGVLKFKRVGTVDVERR
jgi:hypothetical protein